MTFVIKLDGQEIARISGERIHFGTKQERESWTGFRTVEDRNILKQVDAGGNTVWVLMLSHRNLTVEEE